MFLVQLSIGVRVAQLDDGWLVLCHQGHVMVMAGVIQCLMWRQVKEAHTMLLVAS